MERGASFGELLDERLAVPTPEPAAAGTGAPYPRALGFFWFEVLPPSRPIRPSPPPPRAYAPVVSRPSRTLAPGERQALDVLVALGADIDADFTADSLRRVFRVLARRHHPDRHPGSSQQERSRQAALFRQLFDAYRRLQTVARAN